MTKKVRGRPAARSKARPQRAHVRQTAPTAAPEAPPATADTTSFQPATATGAVPAARPGRDAPTRRPAATARRAPGITINYSYLRGDIRTLAVLAPSMVVLLVVAFFVLH